MLVRVNWHFGSVISILITRRKLRLNSENLKENFFNCCFYFLKASLHDFVKVVLCNITYHVTKVQEKIYKVNGARLVNKNKKLKGIKKVYSFALKIF